LHFHLEGLKRFKKVANDCQWLWKALIGTGGIGSPIGCERQSLPLQQKNIGQLFFFGESRIANINKPIDSPGFLVAKINHCLALQITLLLSPTAVFFSTGRMRSCWFNFIVLAKSHSKSLNGTFQLT